MAWGDVSVDVAALDRQNAVTLGRILGRGSVGHAEPVPAEPIEPPDAPDEPDEAPRRRRPLPKPDKRWFDEREARYRAALPRFRATIRIPEVELVYEPGVLIMPRGGILELEILNDDRNTHCAVLPSNGDTQFLWLVNHSRGTATLELDGPGYYWYG